MGELIQFRPSRKRKRAKRPNKNRRSKVPDKVIPFVVPMSVEDPAQKMLELSALVEMVIERVRDIYTQVSRREGDER